MTGLYIHVPFCARACPYCDFDFEVGASPDVERFFAGLERERSVREIADGTPLQTIYVGGGTPSMLEAAGLQRLAGWIDAHFDRTQVVEYTVELNPEHVDAALLDALLDVGVDRVSLGLQTFDPAGLVQLGRVHDAGRGLGAVRAAVKAGLRTSADLIVGWPSQTATRLQHDLEAIVDAGVEHVSIYALTIEEGTAWPKLVARGRRAMPDPDAQADALLQCERVLVAAGLVHYEVASYARAQGRARHNLGYWTWRDYLGLGPSAASARFAPEGGVERRTNPRGLDAWSSDPGAAEIESLAGEAAAVEGIWTGLRQLEGFDVAAFGQRFGRPGSWLQQRVAPWVDRGALQWRDGGRRLAVAPDRWLFHDEISAEILAG